MIIMSKTNIVLCIPTMVIGGVETVFITTVEELLKNPDLNITIATHAKIREPIHVQWLKQHPDLHVYTYYPLCNWFEDIAKKCKFFPIKQIRKMCFSMYKKYRRTLCHARRIFSNADIFIDYKNLSFYKELKRMPAPKISWVHGNVDYLANNHLAARIHIYDYIVGITDDFVCEFKRKYPEYTAKIVQIYNPFDIENVRTMARATEKISGKYFCQVSRLDENQKDISTLIRAFDMFYEQNDAQDTKLIIVGGGPDESKLKHMAGQMKSAKNISFVGPSNAPLQYMHGAIANILSTKYEGLGMVLLESAALNTLNIAADCHSGPAEVLLNGDGGILFAPGDADALARAMGAAYYGGAAIQKKIANCADALVRFAPNKIAQDITDLIYRTISSKDTKCL